MQRIVRQLRHGQITIPKDLRDALGLQQDDLLAISLSSGKLEIEPLRVGPKAGGSAWARRLYEEYAPARKRLRSKSEAAVNRAVAEALKETRARRR